MEIFSKGTVKGAGRTEQTKHDNDYLMVYHKHALRFLGLLKNFVRMSLEVQSNASRPKLKI